jgi:tetratricopeptide (TPR) repeat protein
MMRRAFAILYFIIVAVIVSGQGNYDLLLRAKALHELGRTGEAVNILSGAMASSQDSRIYLLRADLLMASGNYSGAQTDYDKANSLKPLSGEYGLSRLFALKRDAKTSLIHLEKNLASPFKKEEKEIFLDPVFSLIENTPEWRLFWKTERYNDEERLVSEIEYSVSRGSREDALTSYKELSGRYPSEDKTGYAKALVDYSMQKYPESVTGLTKLLSVDKGNIDYLDLLSRVQTAAGNMPGAAAAYSRMIELEHPDATLFIKRADCYRKMQDYDKASADIDKFLLLYPEDSEAIRLKGRLESERGDNLKAIELFSKNINLHSENPQVFIDRGNSYFVSRSWDYAEKDYSMALDLDPANSDVWLNKGIALINTGRTEEACHDFRKALELGNKKAAGYISRSCIK